MAITTYANNPNTTATGSGGGGSILSGDTTFTVASSSSFPGASNSAVPTTQFHIADPAVPGELITVTNISGTTWTVTRGAESTSAAAHAANATFYQVVSAGDLTAMKQASGALVSPVTIAGTTTETVVASYSPVTNEIVAGTTFELVATGSIQLTSTPTITWNLRWGGVAGTSLLTLVTGTNCTALNSSMSVARPFDVNGTVTFISTTSAIANINFWFSVNGTTTLGQGVNSNATAVTGLTAPPGGGPLVLTAKWSTTSTQNSLVVPGPLVYRAA